MLIIALWLEIFLIFSGASGPTYDVVYSVEETAVIEPIAGQPNDYSAEVWKWVAQSADMDIVTKHVDYFRVYEDKSDDAGAYVQQAENYDGWLLAVNLDGFETDTKQGQYDAVALLVHEFAHILSYNSDQLDWTVASTSCPRYSSEEGCANEDSYIQAFVDTFWTDVDFAVRTEALEDEATDDLVSEWYETRSQDYVSEYAATDEGEDFAESFTQFIFDNKPAQDAPGFRDNKINFFYLFPELVTLRDSIRERNYELIVKSGLFYEG